MRELDQLRRLADYIREPSLDAIVRTARRRRRRAAMTATVVGAALALLAGGTLANATYDRSAPPVDQPSVERMTPEQIVTRDASVLVTAASSPEDPDVRISLWVTDTGSTRSALALTSDGFATTTYVAAPLRVQFYLRPGESNGPRIESLTEDLFLLVDTKRAREWLVSSGGTVQQVERVQTRITPTDPRLWFRCRPAEIPSAWKESGAVVDPASMYPWCALDPETATAYEWPAPWRGSLELPTTGGEPWGVDTLGQPTFAWWEADGQRHRRFLAESPPDERGVVWNPPTGGPLFFTRIGFVDTLDLVVPQDGPAVRVITRDAPGDHPPKDQFDLMVGTPEGALLAVRTRFTGGIATTGRYHETTVWRAEDLGGDFELVHESTMAADLAPDQTAVVHEPTVVGDRIQIMTPRGAVLSDDDGRTWTEITTWR